MSIRSKYLSMKLILAILLLTNLVSCGGGGANVKPSASGASNVLTDLSGKRVKTLVKQGKSLTQANVQSENELANIFGIRNIHKLDVSQNEAYQQDNAMLLLLTGALQDVAKKQAIDSQYIIDEISLDFSDDGRLTEQGDDWFLRMQAVVRSNPYKYLDQYAQSLKSTQTPMGKFLPQLIPLASRPSAITPKEVFAELDEIITLDGSASHDNNQGVLINYTWFRIDQRKQFNVPMNDRFSMSPRITAPSQETELLYALTVTDEQKLTDTTIVKVIIRKPSPKNTVPVANSQTLETDEDTPVNIVLTGSDADSDAISFVVTTPMLLPNGLLDGTAPTLTYTPNKDFFGSDSFTFKVNDGSEDSLAAIVSITVKPVNDSPIADAGTPKEVTEEAEITLSGSGTDIEDGDNVSYLWTTADGIDLIDLTSPTPHFISPLVGDESPKEFTFTLVVHDSEGLESEPSTVIITVSHENIAPTADAGDPQTVLEQTEVTLHGSGTDPEDGDNVSYQWVSKAGQGVTLVNSKSATPSFLAPSVIDKPIILEFTLTVTDSKGLVSLPSTVKITVSKENKPPVANAGFSRTVIEKTRVFLSGSGRDPEDGINVSYEWKAPFGIFLFNANTNGPSFLAPAITGNSPKVLIFTLVVRDSQKLASVPSTVRVIVKKANTPPIADAGNDQTVFEGAKVTLHGKASDKEDGSNVTFSWFTLNGGLKLNKASTLTPTFIAPSVGKIPVKLTLILFVRDREGLVSTDSVVITVKEKNNTHPIANAGPDQTGQVSETITLDGSASSDPDGDSLIYKWSLSSKPSGSEATLNNPTSVHPSLVLDLPGSYVAQLIVNDGTTDSIADTVTINTSNSKPIANAGQDKTGQVSETITLDGSASSDPDGDSLTYKWSLSNKPSGSEATLNNPTSVNPSLVLDLPGSYVAQLIVNDGTTDSIADTVTINTNNSKPIANAGPDQTVHLDTNNQNPVTLDGTNSFDPDNDDLSFLWQVTAPDGTSVTLPNSDTVLFHPTQIGNYKVTLIVNDGTLNSDPHIVTITVTNTQPIANAGSDLTKYVYDTVELDGSKSSDDDNDSLSYSWVIIQKPKYSSTELSNPTTINPNFVPDIDGEYIIQLIVNDGIEDSTPDSVTVIVEY